MEHKNLKNKNKPNNRPRTQVPIPRAKGKASKFNQSF